MSLARSLLGPLYARAVRLRNGDIARRIGAAAGAPQYRLARRRNPAVLSVDIDPPMGLGATLAKALQFHELAEREGTTPRVGSTNPLYTTPGDCDCLSRYFARESFRSDVGTLTGRAYLHALRAKVSWNIPLATAGAIFARHFRPAARVADMTRSVLAGRTGFDLSIHFRGTDKHLESGAVGPETMFAALDRALAGRPSIGDVFLATDDMRFEAEIKRRYPRLAFTTYNLARLREGQPRHFSTMSPDDKAMEAIVNIFLIAAAPLCLRTSSYLSAISAIASPQMETRTINTTLGNAQGFPENAILAAEARRPA